MGGLTYQTVMLQRIAVNYQEGNEMNNNQNEQILLEILRISLISIRGLAGQKKLDRKSHEKISYWANLCHSLPPIIMGKSDIRALSFFSNWDLKLFCTKYPDTNEALFKQIVALRDEIDNVLLKTPPNAGEF